MRMSGRGNILPRKDFPDVHLLSVSPEVILYMSIGCGRDQLSMLAREVLPLPVLTLESVFLRIQP